jgi:hypothetical protein
VRSGLGLTAHLMRMVCPVIDRSLVSSK